MEYKSETTSVNQSKTFGAIAKIGLFLLSCAATLIGISVLPLARSGAMSLLFVGVVSCTATFLLTCVFVRWDKVSLASVGASINRTSLRRLAFGLCVGSMILGTQWALMFACGHVHWQPARVGGSVSVATTIIAFMFLAAREELAFHGFALRRLDVRFGLWISQITIAAVFALEHIAGGTSLVNALSGAAVGSLLFGMASIATRGLAVPIGIHAAWNIGDWLRGGKEMPGLWHPVVERGYESYTQMTGLCTYVMLMVIATFAFWRFHRTRRSIVCRD